jgi:crotonobetainyl-CoA:carnitine CoA-transferase CaiB-like acyl-CoA transferase
VIPYQVGTDSLYFETFNRNKKSLALNLSSAAGRKVLRDLVAKSDAVFSNLRGDVPERIGLTYRQLAPTNRRIVCCSLTGFGMNGPLQSEPAYDYILQGIAGWMSLTGEPDGPPAKSGLSLVDFISGTVAAFSLVTAVHAARRDGVGCDCDLSLFDASIAMLSYVATWHMSRGWEPQRVARSAHPSLVPFQNFPTSDGWVVIGCAKEKFWERTARVLGRPELSTDPRFDSFATRAVNSVELLAIMSEILRGRTTAEWVKELRAVSVPCGPINTVEEALEEPQTAARDLVLEYEHDTLGTVRTIRTPARIGSDRPAETRAPRLDEHAADILGGLLGYGQTEINRLADAGAFGSN